MLKLSEQVAKLQDEIAELKPKAEAAADLETKLADITSKLDVANTDATALKGKLAVLEAEKTELSGKVTKLEGEKKTVDEAADVKAREIAARAGLNLPGKDPKAGLLGSQDKTMARADFELLSAKDQRAFCMGGGKLTN